MPDAETAELLKRAYRKGSMIGVSMSDYGLGREYADDFFAYLERQVGDLRGKDVLELGCGRGTLLKRIRGHGARVVGLDPADSHDLGLEREGEAIIQDWFPSQQLRGRFDVVIHYGVLEHIEDPVSFLRQHEQVLGRDGVVVFSVPNREPYVEAGDISIFLHEHWNYFELTSLEQVMALASMRRIDMRNGDVGDTLYVVCSPEVQAPAGVDGPDALQPRWRPGFFDSAIRRVRGWLESHLGRGEVVGIYCPGRIMNYLGGSEHHTKVRFFDDEPAFRGKFYPPFPIPVENRDDLARRPVDALLVASRFFGGRIASNIIGEEILSGDQVMLLEELLAR
jgi:SAM-dependent methyltransferase